MKEILIINLTRMGDLLQTTPLMAGLKERHPYLKITLIANSGFAEICKRIPFVDNLILFDMKVYRNRLLEKQYTLVDNYRFLEALINEINQKEYDLAINVTHSPISAILTSLVSVKEIRGFTIDSEGHRVIKHPWMRYFFNVVPNRDYNPFHLVDMYIKIGGETPKRKGLFFKLSKEDEERAEIILSREGIVKGDMLIGLHLGASKGNKRWPVSSYAELANFIYKNIGATILLFGSEDEADLADDFMLSANVNQLNFVGKTSLGELAALLNRCTLFITNDTGPLHIATAVGTRVIDLSTANVHFMETGPYGEDHYVVQAELPCVPCGFDVECKDMICKSIISPHAVFEVVKDAIEWEPATYSSDSPVWKDLQVYRSYFKEDGLLGFYPLIKRPISKETLYRLLFRQVWNMENDETLIPAGAGIKVHESIILHSPPLVKGGIGGFSGRTNGKADTAYENVCEELSSFYSLDNINEIIISIRKELDILEKLVDLSEKGLNLVSIIAEEAARENLNILKIKETWKTIEHVDNEIELIGYANPCFRPFIIVFRYAKEAMENDELQKLAENSCMIYRNLIKNSSNILYLIKRLIPFLESISGGEKCGLTSYKTKPLTVKC